MSLVTNTFLRFSDAFWSESIWLPPNITWKTYELQENGVNYAQFNDIYYSLITAVVIISIRWILERFIFRPVGLKLGVKDKITSRKRLNKPTNLTRFTESSWRCFFYLFIFLYGLWALHDKPWTWDSMKCFIDFPHHSVSPEIWWYYNIELGFYLSLIVSQFSDVEHSDFWQMFIHHVVTVLLLCFSWACNLHRIGTLVLVIHDFADIPLEGAKITRYLRTTRLANVIFAVFLVCWIYSRLVMFPRRVIFYSVYYALEVIHTFPAYYILNGLLCMLQILHIIWTWLILKIAHNTLFADGFKDLRENDDDEDNLED